MSKNIVCRICLEKGVMRSIFKERRSSTISAKIMSLARVQIYPEDGLPSTICTKCLKCLDQCTDFIQLCEESDAKLRATLTNTLPFKSEIPIKYSPKNENDSTENYHDDNVENKTENVDTVKSEIVISTESPIGNEEIEIVSENKVFSSTKVAKKRKRSKNRPHQCTICGKILAAWSSLQKHLRTHSDERPFACTQCPKTFRLKTNLTFHLMIHTGEKPSKCTECNRSFRHPSCLRVHQRIHKKETPHKCMLCPKSYHTATGLRYHLRVHTGEKDYECDLCGRAFISRSHLNQHVNLHSGERKFMCFVCGSRFSRAEHLRRHLRNVHNKHGTEAEEDGCITQEQELDVTKRKRGRPNKSKQSP